MKHMKKLLSLAMALAMVLALGVSASATKINGLTGHDYQIYKIFAATAADNSSLKEFRWAAEEENATNYVTPSTFITALYALAQDENPAIAKIGGSFSDLRAASSSAEDVAKAIQDAMKNNNPDLVAEVVAKAASGSLVGNGMSIAQDLEPGYYVLKDSLNNGGNVSYSVYQVTGKEAGGVINITDKNDSPKPEKKVHADDGTEPANITVSDNGWQMAADYKIGDVIPFQLSTTVLPDYATVSDYKIAFCDKMDEGLTLLAEPALKVEILKADGTTVTVPTTAYTAGAGHDAKGEAVDLKVEMDLKTQPYTSQNLAAGDKIVVTYYAQLNEKAVLGTGGTKNHVELDWTVGTKTGTTPGNDVTVFTFNLVADKTDGEGKALTGADFELTVFDEATKAFVQLPNVKKTMDATPDVEAATDAGKANTRFTFSSLDAGIYKLHESKVPEGYNGAADMYFEVAPVYSATDPNTVVSLDVYICQFDATTNTVTRGAKVDANTSISADQGTYNVAVVNNTGITLPSTGGIGTTIFYIVGGLLAAGAVILLITKRRMRYNED